MSKKKVLFCSEASWLSTGYSVYTKEVLSRLKDVETIEVAELACYAAVEDLDGRDIPWKVYPNKPSPNDPALDSYNGNPSAQFGEQAFNQVLLHYQPDIVIDIRDWWMMEYQQRSPFRDFFHWAIMPTVDATPQADQWINTYASADAVFAYSEFGRDTLLSQCEDIKFVDIASPSASNAFMPYEDKGSHKASMGLSSDVFIVGTVMRNQKRKLYPDLFESFRKFLNEVQDPNVYLLCHTYYPDVGWDIPKLVGINNSINENELASVYNLFDVYVQYANSEGFGMPQLEAAQCSLPVVSTYYSAMKSIVDNINAIGIEPLSYYLECETGCKRAVPDNSKFIEELVKLYHGRAQLPELGAEMRNNALDHYNWDKTADTWLNHIIKVRPKDPQETWLSPPKILKPDTTIPNNLGSMVEKVNHLFYNTLHKPEWIGGYLWRKVLKDCTFGYRCENLQKDFYFNESHMQSQQGNQAFSIDDAIKELVFFRGQTNEWEKARYEKVSSKGRGQ